VPEKGVADAVRACAMAGVPLKVLGDGRLRGELEELAASLDADVEFLGHVSQDTVTEHLRTAGVAIVPSIWHEVSALVLTQSMSAHTPVIATDTGGTAELVGDGRGFLYPPGDIARLAELVRTVIDRPELGRETAARAAAFARTERTKERWLQRMRGAYAMVGLDL
jgi:glycosyltransferase involved in cell wall biosynthesis